SSRRRHTRFSRDWSSDVCSSDLAVAANPNLRLLVVESAYGQLLALVKAELYGFTNAIDTLLKPGVGITAEEIMAAVTARTPKERSEERRVGKEGGTQRTPDQ